MAEITKPFLTFYTPTYQRPKLLEECQASVRGQNLDEWEQVIIRDEIGIGIDGMFAAVIDNVDLIRGEYVYFLQDDDVLVDKNVVRDLKSAALGSGYPPVIIVKNMKRGNVYPSALFWQEKPTEGHIDLGSYVVRADVFCRHADDFGHRYAGDVDFILALWQAKYRFVWYDRLVARAQALGLGRPERMIK